MLSDYSKVDLMVFVGVVKLLWICKLKFVDLKRLLHSLTIKMQVTHKARFAILKR